MKNLAKLAVAGSVLLCSQSIAGGIDLNFDNIITDRGTGASIAGELEVQGSVWSGGAIAALDNRYRASGSHAYVVSGSPATVVFSRPVNNVRFFFVHGDGIAAGTATAFNADGRVLATADSKAATSFGDSRNFVRFRTSEPIAAIEFSGGVVDAFSAAEFEVDYFLVQSQWVNNEFEVGNRQGLTFDFLSTSNVLFVAWYTYTSTQTGPEFDDVGAVDNRWLTAQLDVGVPGPNMASGLISASSGGAFDLPNTGEQETIQVGTMTVEFLDCDLAIVTYELDSGISNQFSIIPLEKHVNGDLFRCDPKADVPEVFEPDVSQTDADIDVMVRAAVDATRIAMQFTWETNKNYAGILHDIRGLNDEGEWVDPVAGISPGYPTRINEDRIALIFGLQGAGDLTTQSRNLGCFQACHADMVDMPQDSGAEHYVINNVTGPGVYQRDMWHWRGSRSGPLGFAEDTWVRSEEFGTGGAGRRRDATGPDGRLRENQGFGTEYTVTVAGESLTLKLPDFVFDPALNSGFYFFNDGVRLITEDTIGNLFSAQSIEKMEAGELQHALITNGPLRNVVEVADLSDAQRDAVAAEALAGGLMIRPFLQDDTTGTSDQHDVRLIRQFENGRWTVTLIRDLVTGSEVDIDLSGVTSGNVSFGFAIHDSNAGGRTHQISLPLTVGLGGDIMPAAVDDVEAVNWPAIQAFSTRTFKPGDISFEWLRNQDGGHPVEVNAPCSSCHLIASQDHGPFGPQQPGACRACHTDGDRAANLWEYAPLNLQD